VNNFFSQLMARGKSTWAAMAAGPRIALISFIGIMLLMVVAVSMWSSQTEYMLVYGGLTPEDAAAISSKLKDEKIPFKYETSRGAILVPPNQVDSARLLLAAQGLPKATTEGFELFDKSSFGTTEFVQRINYVRALQGTLARNIQAIDSVESARVQLTIPEDEVFAREKREAKAGVVVTMRSGKRMTAEQIGAIRHLVSASVPKLDTRNVTIMDSTGRMLSRLQEAGDMGALTEEQLGMQKKVEDHLTDKVQTLLDQVMGPGKSVVRVTAQLNFERAERSVQKIDPESQVKMEESIRKDESTGKTAGAGGVPGVASNTADATTTASAGSANTNSHKQSSATNRYQYNTVSERIVAETGALKRLSVAVLVAPKSEAGADGAAAAVTPRTDKEMKKLEEIVKSAVGYAPERKDSIQVNELAFSEQGSAALALPTPVAPVNPWLEMLQRHMSDGLAFLAVAVMAFVFWRLFTKTQIAPATTVANATGTVNPDGTYSVNTSTIAKTDPINVQKELQDLVGQNSTQAATVIRTLLKK
jgi:flagellar M-ring protein FliF